MMEALKLLTSELTVDLNQTEMLVPLSQAGEDEEAEAEVAYLPSSLGGHMSKSLL